MGNDVDKQNTNNLKVTLFSNFLPHISSFPVLTTSKSKFILSIKPLLSIDYISTKIIFTHFISNFIIFLANTNSQNSFLFLIHQCLIKEYYFITFKDQYTKKYLKALKGINDSCLITITPANQIECNEKQMNQIFDLNLLYKRGVKLNKEKRNTMKINDRTFRDLKYECYSKKRKTIKYEKDNIKDKNIDEIYEEYIKRNKIKKLKENEFMTKKIFKSNYC